MKGRVVRHSWFILLLLALAGCGFSPIYAPRSGRTAQADLQKVFVAVIPNRPGQLLRQALQVQLEGSGGSQPRLYTLTVGYGVSSEGIGINADSSSSFVRFRARADWQLLSSVPGTPPLVTGIATAQDSYSVIVDQYFYSDLSNTAVYRRVADAIADQIVLRLAAYFHNRAKVAAQ